MIGASGCEVISVVDLRDAYHTLRLDGNSQKYCGITPYMGSPTYLYQRLGMGLTVSPAIWQNFINKVLDEIPNRKHHLAIMDDCLIHTKKKDHKNEIVALFRALVKHGLKISPKKCQFFRKKLTYMGHTIMIVEGQASITALKTHCDAIMKLNAPHTVRGVKHIIGMANFLGSYIKDLQGILAPMYRLTKKSVEFDWGTKEQEALERLKKALTTPPVLVMPNATGMFILESDTSKVGIGAALFQMQDGQQRLCAYHSKRLPDACSRYGISELELYGLTNNIVAFKHTLMHVYFEAYVDHSALVHIMSAKHEPATLRIQRLLETLSRFAFGLGYKPGRHMTIADFMSRHPHNDTDPYDEVIPVSFGKGLDPEDRFQLCKMRSETFQHAYSTRSKGPAPATEVPRELLDAPRPRKPRGPERTEEYTPPPTQAETTTGSATNAQAWTLPPPEPQHQQPLFQELPRRTQGSAAVGHAEKRARTLEQILDPMPVDITLYGTPVGGAIDQHDVPSVDITTLRPTSENQQWREHRKGHPQLVRRTMTKQSEITPLLRDIARQALRNYNLPITMAEVTQAYKNSPYFKAIYKYVQHGATNFIAKADRVFREQCGDYFLLDGLLFKLVSLGKGEEREQRAVLCVPEVYIYQILHAYHDSVLAGHDGITRTIETVKKHYFFPRMAEYVRQYISSCHVCQQVKEHSLAKETKFNIKIPTNYRPFDICHIDVKHMPMSRPQGHKYMLVMVCQVTHYVEAASMSNETAEMIYEVIFSKIVSRYGPPRVLVSDRHAALIGSIARFFNNRLRTRQITIGPESKHSNLAERYIQSIANKITKYLTDEGQDWTMFVAPCLFAFNTFTSPVTGFSPYEMVFVRIPPALSVIQHEVETTPIAPDQYVRALGRRLQAIQRIKEVESVRQQES